MALAQADHGVLTREEAAAVVAAARVENVDLERLWARARIVGYPIVGLIEQIRGAMNPQTAGRLHFGVTTQDITEIAEVFEPFESHRGASSTMPQKVNPAVARTALLTHASRMGRGPRQLLHEIQQRVAMGQQPRPAFA